MLKTTAVIPSPSHFVLLFAVTVIGMIAFSCRAPSPPPKHIVSLSKDQAARLFGSGNKSDSAYRQRRAREYFLRGSSLQMEKRHAEAILDFQMSLRFDSSAVTLFALAKNYAELGRNDVALDYAQASIMRDSAFLPALEIAGTSYLAVGEIEKAAQVYEKLVELDSNAQQHRFVLARIYELLNPAKALELYQALQQETGGNEQILRRLADLYRNMKQEQQYELTLEQLYAKTGASDVNEELLAAYCASRNFDRALTALARTTVISDADDISRLFGAVGQAILEKHADSVPSSQQLQQFLHLASQERFFDWQTNIIAGMIAYSANDTIAADKYFDRATSLSDQPDAAMRIGLFYLQKNDYLRAAARFDHYDSIFVNSLFALYAGYAYSSSGNYDKALSILHRGVESDSSNVEIWAQIGLVSDRLGKSAESDAAYETALKYDPNNATVNNNLAYSLAERGIELKRALALSRKAINVQPHNASFLDTQGWILFGMKKYNEALEYLEKAAKSGGAGAVVFEHLGDCYSKLAMNEDAASAYKKALEIAPGRESSAERLRKLEK